MKIFRISLFITIISSLLCAYSSSAYEKPKTVRPAFIGQPALAGIEQIYVVILRTDSGDDKNSLIWRALEEKVEKKLKDAGVKIAPASYVGSKFKALNVPELRFSINTLKLTDSKQCVFHIQTTLVRNVQLTQKPQGYIKAGVWETKPIMQSAALTRVDNQITRFVSIEVEKFIQTYLTANLKDVPVADVNLPTQVKKKIETSAQTQIEYQSIASKNGKVFHKPECSSVRRIKPENRITYESRDTAIKSGKSPCKLCKP